MTQLMLDETIGTPLKQNKASPHGCMAKHTSEDKPVVLAVTKVSMEAHLAS